MTYFIIGIVAGVLITVGIIGYKCMNFIKNFKVFK